MQKLNLGLEPTIAESPRTEYAYFLERALAFTIDYFPFPLLGLLSLACLYKMGLTLTIFQDIVWISFWLLLFMLYHAIFNSGGRRTLGKFLLGIKVVSVDDEEPISFGKAFLRGFITIFEAFTFFIGFLFALITKKKQTLHDLLLKTTVISTREKSATEIMVISIAGTLLCAMLIVAKYYSFFIAPDLQERVAVQRAKAQIEDIVLLEKSHKNQFGYYTNDILRLSLISGDPVQFQRDLQRNLFRKGFRIGVNNNEFSVTAYAKDSDKTQVYYNSSGK